MKKLLSLLTMLIVAISASWADTVLFTTNFSTADGWDASTSLASGSKVINGTTISFKNGGTVTAGETSGSLAFGSTNITGSKTNVSELDNYIAIPVTGVVGGKVTVTTVGGNTNFYYCYSDGSTTTCTARAQQSTKDLITITGLTNTNVTIYIGSGNKTISNLTVTTPELKDLSSSAFYSVNKQSDSSVDASTLINDAELPSYISILSCTSTDNGSNNTSSVTTPYDFSGIGNSRYYRLKPGTSSSIVIGALSHVKSIRVYGNGSGSTGNLVTTVTKISGTGTAMTVGNKAFVNSKSAIAEYSTGDLTALAGYDADTYYEYKLTFSANFSLWGIYVEYGGPVGPSISAEDVNITKDATSEGEISFSVSNPVAGGVVTAATEADWLTPGEVDNTNGKVPFSATANTGAPRNATVTLTYTYTDGTEKTVTKDVTITQAAPTYAITYSPGASGTGSIDAGEKSYGVDFTLSAETFSRDGFVQTGWATTDGGEKAYELGGTYSANAAIELFPVWTAASTYTADFSDFTKGIPAGWTFSYDSSAKYGDAAATADFVGTFNALGSTTPHGQSSISDNMVAFAKNASAYAMLDLGQATTVYSMTTTLYGGSSSAFNETIEYLGEDGTTVKKTYTNSLSAGNWAANNISKSDVVADVRYIKIYGASKWTIMSAFSVVTSDEAILASKVKTNSAGWATYTPSQNATVASGAQAYIITAVKNTSVNAEEVSVMKAGEGYFIKGTASTEYAITFTNDAADDVTGSMLQGCLNGAKLAAGTTPYNYVLGVSSSKAGLFYVGANEVIVPSGKCYLQSDVTENPQNLTLDFEQATAVDAVAEANAEAAAPVKVIKNGKLYIGKYNVAGQQVK